MQIKLLFPIIWETYNKTNDFLFIIVKTILAKNGINGVKRIQQLKRGMSLVEKPEEWDELLKLNKLIDWFSSHRECDMVSIGPLIGYFLRCRASQLCRQLDHKWKPMPNFADDMTDLLRVCEKAVKPVVIVLNVVESTARRFLGFVTVSDELFESITQKQFVGFSKRTTIYPILPEYETWAWKCLDNGNTQHPISILPIISTFMEEQPTAPTIVEERGEDLSAASMDLSADLSIQNEAATTEEYPRVDSTSTAHSETLPEQELIVASHVNVEMVNEDLSAGSKELSTDASVVLNAATTVQTSVDEFHSRQFTDVDSDSTLHNKSLPDSPIPSLFFEDQPLLVSTTIDERVKNLAPGLIESSLLLPNGTEMIQASSGEKGLDPTNVIPFRSESSMVPTLSFEEEELAVPTIVEELHEELSAGSMELSADLSVQNEDATTEEFPTSAAHSETLPEQELIVASHVIVEMVNEDLSAGSKELSTDASVVLNAATTVQTSVDEFHSRQFTDVDSDSTLHNKSLPDSPIPSLFFEDQPLLVSTTIDERVKNLAPGLIESSLLLPNGTEMIQASSGEKGLDPTNVIPFRSESSMVPTLSFEEEELAVPTIVEELHEELSAGSMELSADLSVQNEDATTEEFPTSAAHSETLPEQELIVASHVIVEMVNEDLSAGSKELSTDASVVLNAATTVQTSVDEFHSRQFTDVDSDSTLHNKSLPDSPTPSLFLEDQPLLVSTTIDERVKNLSPGLIESSLLLPNGTGMIQASSGEMGLDPTNVIPFRSESSMLPTSTFEEEEFATPTIVEERDEVLSAGSMELSADLSVQNEDATTEEFPTSAAHSETLPESSPLLRNGIETIQVSSVEMGLDPNNVIPFRSDSVSNIQLQPRRSKRKLSPHADSHMFPSTHKKKKQKRTYMNTRSQRSATVPENTTFEWVNVGKQYRPAFIHKAKADGLPELAQLITTNGDTCQKVYSFSRASIAPKKPSTYLLALANYNNLYGTNYE